MPSRVDEPLHAAAPGRQVCQSDALVQMAVGLTSIAAKPCSFFRHAGGPDAQPHSSSRRDVLGAAIAAPLLHLLPWAAAAAAPSASEAAAIAGPRYLTAEQQAAVDAAFDAALPKAKVVMRC